MPAITTALKQPQVINKNHLLKVMYKRILLHARTSITRNIKKVMNNDGKKEEPTVGTNSIETIRAETRKLKQMIQILESSVHTKTHLNDIKTVTIDGHDLSDDDGYSVSSNEVLHTMIVLHEIE